MTPLSTSAIDELLRRYREAETRMAANLVELDDHPTYALAIGDAFSGHTAERVDGPVSRAPQLWQILGAFRQALDSAGHIRADGRMNDERRTELTELLTGRSVLVYGGPAKFGDSDLASGRRTIEDLLAEIRASYEPLRDAVASIDEVWRDLLPRFDAAETTLRELRRELDDLGSREPTVTIAERQLADARAVVMDDPLGLSADVGHNLDTAVHEAARHVGELRRGHETLREDLALTEALVADARSLRSRAATAAAEARAKVLDHGMVVAVPAPALIDELANRAAALRQSADGPWQATRVTLDGWLETAERLVSQLGDANRRNHEPLLRRDQLRGLWRAYKAKAASVGAIESPEVGDLLDQVHNELFTAPADLDRAEALIEKIAAAMATRAQP